MKKNVDEIAELFRSRLSQYEIPLKEDLWNDIESDLSKPSSKKIYLTTFVAIAALFILLFACSAAVKLFNSEREINYSKVDDSVSNPCTRLVAKKNNLTQCTELSINKTESLSEINNREECNSEAKNVVIAEDKTVSNKLGKQLANLEPIKTNEEERSSASEHTSTDHSWSVGVLASIESKLHTPMSLGVSVSKKINNKISLESGLQYTYSNTDRLEYNSEYFAANSIHSLGIPLKIKFELLNKNNLSLYALGGVLIEKNIIANQNTTSNKDDKKFDINRIESSLISAIGLQFKVADNIGLFVESGLVYHINNHTPLFAAKYDNPLNVNIACGMKISY